MADILVTAKVHPDLDGVACSLAYADLLSRTGQSAEGRVFGTAQSEVSYFIDELRHTVQYLDPQTPSRWSKYILVDASSMLGMPTAVNQSEVVEIIDHREGESEKEFPQASIQNELVGAAATLVVERFMNAKLEPKPDHAKFLYGAIYHNTLNFSSPNTTNRDRKAFTWLEKFPGCDSTLTKNMFEYATRKIYSDIPSSLRQDAKRFTAGDITIGAYQLVVQGFDLKKFGPEIAAATDLLDKEFRCPLSFLNVSDIGAMISYFYVPNPKSQVMISDIFGASFVNSWAQMPLILRKQIMPKVKDYVLSHRHE